jgi:hypothetical protein
MRDYEYTWEEQGYDSEEDYCDAWTSHDEDEDKLQKLLAKEKIDEVMDELSKTYERR